MSPEVANSKPYNHLSEVFSFATVLWELCYLALPFDTFSADTFKAAVLNGARPPLPHKHTAGLPVRSRTGGWRTAYHALAVFVAGALAVGASSSSHGLYALCCGIACGLGNMFGRQASTFAFNWKCADSIE